MFISIIFYLKNLFFPYHQVIIKTYKDQYCQTDPVDEPSVKCSLSESYINTMYNSHNDLFLADEGLSVRPDLLSQKIKNVFDEF